MGIVGAGAVGQSVAAALVTARLSHRVRITSLRPARTLALVTDLEDLAQLCGSPVRAESCEIADLTACEAVVICLRSTFTNTAARDVRMAGLQANAPHIATLAGHLVGYRGTVVVVTNPVDVMTRLLAEVSGVHRVYGVGSNLDSARYRLALAHLLGVPVSAVDGHVIGEHGDKAVICATATRIGGLPLTIPLREVRAELAARPGRITAGGRARFGPAAAVLAALRAALGLTDAVVELCAQHGDAWHGIPLHFTAGTPTPFLPPLDASEARQLADADRKLAAAYHQIRYLHPRGESQ
ncbi:lactate dehydrogenase [Streptomyces sp. NPDC050610]|uniref:lactate/malate family dehydrogenase n=1 Tax=Streptomyces sp. NPDC050610 TaxID=3157097 RepID=UPI0034138687